MLLRWNWTERYIFCCFLLDRNKLNRIIYKELNILIKQFYSKFWSLKKSTIEKIKDEILEKIEILDLQNASLVADENPDISLYNIITDEEEMKENAYFTAVLYGKENDE